MKKPFSYFVGQGEYQVHALMSLNFTIKKLVPSFNVDSLIFLQLQLYTFFLQQHLNLLKIAKLNNLPSRIVFLKITEQKKNEDIFCYTNKPPLSRPWCTKFTSNQNIVQAHPCPFTIRTIEYSFESQFINKPPSSMGCTIKVAMCLRIMCLLESQFLLYNVEVKRSAHRW